MLYLEVETFAVPVSGPNLTGDVPPLDRGLATQAADPRRVVPKEIYLIPIDGPNLAGKVPPLKKDTAVPLHEKGLDIATIVLCSLATARPAWR